MPEIPEDLPSTMETATMVVSTLSGPPLVEGYHRYEFTGGHAFEQARLFIDEYRMNAPWYGTAVSVAVNVLVSTVWATRSMVLQCRAGRIARGFICTFVVLFPLRPKFGKMCPRSC